MISSTVYSEQNYQFRVQTAKHYYKFNFVVDTEVKRRAS